MPLKKKGKRKTKKSAKTKSIYSERKDPVAPEYIRPAPLLGEKLIKLLSEHPVHERDLYGVRVSTVALQKLTPQEIGDLKVVFDAFDVNEKGVIGAVELRRAMRALGFHVDRDDVRHILQTSTTNPARTTIDFNEFLDIIIEHQADSRDVQEEILQGFQLLDYDDSGLISMDCLKRAAADCGVKFSKQDLRGMMEEADKNGDGFVDKDEFMKIMLQTNLF